MLGRTGVNPRPVQAAACAFGGQSLAAPTICQENPAKEVSHLATRSSDPRILAGAHAAGGTFVAASRSAFLSEDWMSPGQADYGKFFDDVTDLGATDLELVVRWFQVDTKAIEIAPRSLYSRRRVADVDDGRGQYPRPACLAHTLTRDRGGGRQATARRRPPTRHGTVGGGAISVLSLTTLASQAHTKQPCSRWGRSCEHRAQTERWRALAKAIRKVYRGKLTYAANIEHIEGIGFWTPSIRCQSPASASSWSLQRHR